MKDPSNITVREIHDQTSRLPQRQLLIVFFALNLALFLSFLDATSVTTALPHIAADLDAESSIIWVGTSFLIANTGFQIITSRLSDIIGRKYVLLAALGLFGIGDLLCGFARSKVWLYVSRAVAGIGGGGINSLSMIIVSDVVSLQERGRYQGLLGISIALGSGIGPILGGTLASKASWRWVFWITPPMTAATMVAIIFLLPLSHPPGTITSKLLQIDWVGSFLSLAGIVLVLVPISGGGSTYAWGSPMVITMIVLGVATIGAFLVWEGMGAGLPILPLRMFRNRTIALIQLQTWLVGMIYYGSLYVTPIYLQSIGGFTSAIVAGGVMMSLTVTQVLTTIITGFIVERTGNCRPSLMFGFVLWFAGQGAQLCFGEGTSTGVIVGVLLLQGLGLGCTLQTSLVLAQASGQPADRAVITGARNFFRTSGGALGLAISTSVVNNLLVSGLPSSLSAEDVAAIRTQGYFIPDGLDDVAARAITTAYAKALHAVFIYFVPVIGLCLLISFFQKDVDLRQNLVPERLEEGISSETFSEWPSGDGSGSSSLDATESEKTAVAEEPAILLKDNPSHRL